MDLSWIYGHARVAFHHAKKTVVLPTKSGEKTSLEAICKEVTPPCYLNPLLFNGHLQTAWTAMKSEGPRIIYKRKIFESYDPRFAGIYTVDFVTHTPAEVDDETLPPRTTYYSETELAELEAGSDDDKPMLITLHGLSGGSHEIYLRQVLAPLVRDGKWEAVVVNSRGCAMSEITTGILYNARATWDMRQTVEWCRKKFPNRPLYAIGYSLGANILTNYLGEEGENCVVNAAVVVASPWNLEVAALALQRTWLGMNVYSKTMANSMRKLFDRHAKMIMENGNIDEEKIRRIKYLHEFDREIQGPTWGYPTEGAYYRDASSVDLVDKIRIPVFIINAEDDPIAVHEAIPYEEIKQNPYTVLCTTSLGGHLSWFEIGGTRWFSKPAANFLQKMADDIDVGKIDGPKGTMAPRAAVAENATGYKSPFVYEPVRRKLRLDYRDSVKTNAALEM
ncbi:hypothetical protein AAFC00_001290 [Neodothiora populina]|uniref:AB hydrolase-1 domain-containing protein n=1 Tax=Neodothiora populina TaxID=2781224 RepID=A0ABR3PNN5_9PEZI